MPRGKAVSPISQEAISQPMINADFSTQEKKLPIFSVERDVTHRKKMEDEIKKERDMLEAVTKSIGAGFIIISKDYRILWANNFIRQYKGEVDGKLCYSVLNTLDKPCPDCGVTKIFAGKKSEDSHEYFSKTVDGRPYWVDIIATPIKDKDGNIVAASELAVDITEKKQREKDLKGSQQEFKALFNSNPEAVVYADESYNFVDVNPKFTEIFGYSLEEVKGKSLIDVLVPDDLKKEERIQAEKSLTEAVSFESKRKCKTGSLLNVFISLAPVLVGDKRIGSVAVFKDMSDIISAEQKIEAALKQSQILNEKLNVIGSFTRHDVRNKLAAINGNVYLAKKRAGENVQIQNYLSQIKLASDNVTRILEFAKNYESLGKEERAYINLAKAVEEATSLFSDLKGVKIINPCKDFEILADSMLTTIFHNLIDNSLKYGENLTKIEVYSRKEEDGSQTIIYADDGVGIDNETKKQLFTKGFGKGTGYGLYLIRRTCDIYGWTVKETGEPGKGARFEFNIPPNLSQEDSPNKTLEILPL
jgi:PAS domain S-box-containing protein